MKMVTVEAAVAWHRFGRGETERKWEKVGA